MKCDSFALNVIRDLMGLEALRETWSRWPGTKHADLDFFIAAARSRGETCRPHVIFLTRNGTPEALLAGLKTRGRIPLRVGSVVLWRPKVTVLEFVYGGLLGYTSAENCTLLIHAVKDALVDGESDVALWEQLNVQSQLYQRVRQLPRLLMRDHAISCQDHWFLRFPESLDSFLQQLGRSQRSKLRRKYRNVLKAFDGRVRVCNFQTHADLQKAIPDMELIASRSAKRKRGFGFFDTLHNRLQLDLEAAKKCLRLYILYIDERPIAFWKGTLYNRCLQAEDVGYDWAWRDYSPGIFLFLKILDRNRGEHIELIDFGCGESQVHRCFANVRQQDARIHIYAPRLRGFQLNVLEALTHSATTLLRRARYFVRFVVATRKRSLKVNRSISPGATAARPSV
jgi:Acetyltransferase (GNAT) domain